ncbi:MAG: hypothetical protein BroJett040_26100 [Oligoflexia bacterium]|nr:MAG: hypothetical protein BroJett040_26100 [Oligoflexia bacterium]
MSEKKKSNTPHPEKQLPSNVVPLTAAKCVGEDCKKKPERAGFCSEHYEWFKEGLLTIDGYKAKDFDKKYHAWLLRKQKAA